MWTQLIPGLRSVRHVNRYLLCVVMLGLLIWPHHRIPDREAVEADASSIRDILPFLERHCIDCHGGTDPEAGVAFDHDGESAGHPEDYEFWERVATVLSEQLMPPESEPQPGEDERRNALAAIASKLARFPCSDPRPGRVTLRRLNRAEYNNTVRDLCGIDFRPADDFPSDDVGEGFDNIGDVLSFSPLLLEKYLRAAEAVVSQALRTEQGRHRLLAAGDNLEDADVARANLMAFSSRAFRRPVTVEEMARLGEWMRRLRDNGGTGDDRFRTALHAILSSPHFIFRVERDSRESAGIRRLNNFELASRLSYFLWSSMPDETLFALARQGALQSPHVLEAQALRMLADEKSAALVDNFAGQWLQLRDLRHLNPDRAMYPDFDDALRAAMLRETEMFFASIIQEDRSVLDLLGADFTFVNERLARHYGIAGVFGDSFQRVALRNRRRGILTHGSILSLTSNPTRTSPVKRGKWILDNILGEPPPPPPEGVDELEEDAEVLGSLRERLVRHRSNESCAVCHRRMDPIGFGLENFDAIGAWRDRDGHGEIDASGTLLGGRTFQGPRELVDILIEEKQDDFCRCLAKKMLTYALGRGLTTHDRCAIDEIMHRLAEGEFRFSALVTAIVSSDPFMLREPSGVE